MTQIQTFQNFKVQYVCVDGNPWFRGNDVAEILGYTRPRKAVQDHVPDEYRNTLENLMLASGSPVSGLPDHNDKIAVFISEAGLYKLVLKSKAKNAEAFSDWVCSEVLPSIRKTGSYVPPPPAPPPAITSMFGKAEYKTDHSLQMCSENDLHFKVVDYIRRFHPHAKMTAGLGEFQTTIALRIEGKMKGYQKGTADLMIMNNHLEFRGFCMEFKNPKGTQVPWQKPRMLGYAICT